MGTLSISNCKRGAGLSHGYLGRILISKPMGRRRGLDNMNLNIKRISLSRLFLQIVVWGRLLQVLEDPKGLSVTAYPVMYKHAQKLKRTQFSVSPYDTCVSYVSA